ncbi:MAG: hypothetical protein ACUVT7_09290 [Thermoplasmata archaeon]
MLGEKGGKSGVVVATVGTAVTLVSFFVVYGMIYRDLGPANMGWRIIVFVTLITAIIFGVVLMIIGFVLFCPPALSGEELTGFVEVR